MCDLEPRGPTLQRPHGFAPVSVAHELSAEIAIAILTGNEQSRNKDDLKDIVLRVHTALQMLSADLK